MKRLVDIMVSVIGLIVLSPVIVPVLLLVWFQDWHSPFYVADRVGQGARAFKMIKVRSMVVNADKSGVDSTSSDDLRITGVGRFIRRYKIDEVSQLINVLFGSMSLVGPRPNVQRDVELYTSEEKRLLTIKPGITDISSIVFSDEGEILKGFTDPDLAYNQRIRPGKGELGLLYVDNCNLSLDFKLIFITVVAIFSKKLALRWLQPILVSLGASKELLALAKREAELVPRPPVGATEIVTTRQV